MKVKYFNKGVAKGIVAKSELIEYENKDKKKDKFLSMEVNTSNGNRVKATVFPTKANPNKAKDLHAQFPVNSKVEVSGNVQEKDFESKSGKKGKDRSISAMSIKPLSEEVKANATFIIQGDVKKIREIEDGVEVIVVVDESYEKDGKKIEKSNEFTLTGDEDFKDLVDDLDIEKGCNVKFKGLILNRLMFDDYGDVTDSVQQFKVEKAEDVISKEDREEEETKEEVDFI